MDGGLCTRRLARRLSGHRDYFRGVALTGIVLAMIVSSCLEARAHSTAELDEWMVGWVVRADTSLHQDLLDEYRDMASRHPGYFAPRPSVPSPQSSGWSGSVEEWRPLVSTYFRADLVETALCLVGYESGGDPDAYNASSGASGLFQHLRRYWTERTAASGWAGADIFDPEANVAVAAWLQRTGGWGHWSPWNRGLCRGL